MRLKGHPFSELTGNSTTGKFHYNLWCHADHFRRLQKQASKAAPPEGTRPTGDKLRETLFNILGETVRGCTFLDGCAGVGAIGIEAISRGAELVVFVDRSRIVTKMIRENLAALGITEGIKILEMDLDKALAVCLRDGIAFDIAFVDPPYDSDEIYDHALSRMADGKLIAADGLAVFEHSKRKQMPLDAGSFKKVRVLNQGGSGLSFYRMEAK